MPRPVPPEKGENGRPIWARNKDGKPICGAKRSNGVVCQCLILYPNGRCRVHGGASTGAPIIHGGRSKLLKNLGLDRHYEDVRQDLEHSSHRPNIHLIGAAMLEASEGEPPAETWQEAVDAFNAIKPGSKSLAESWKKLGAILEGGLDRAKRLERVLTLADQQRKHKEAENRREAALEGNLTARQAMLMTAALQLANEEEIKDRALLRRIGLRFAAIMRGATGIRVNPGSAELRDRTGRSSLDAP